VALPQELRPALLAVVRPRALPAAEALLRLAAVALLQRGTDPSLAGHTLAASVQVQAAVKSTLPAAVMPFSAGTAMRG
jgi:hypothetical protein